MAFKLRTGEIKFKNNSSNDPEFESILDIFTDLEAAKITDQYFDELQGKKQQIIEQITPYILSASNYANEALNSARRAENFTPEGYVNLVDTLDAIEDANFITILSGTYNGTRSLTIDVDIKAGQYAIEVDNIVSSDTDANYCDIVFTHGTNVIGQAQLPRGNNVRQIVRLTDHADKLYLRASSNYVTSENDTFTFEGFKILYSYPLKQSEVYAVNMTDTIKNVSPNIVYSNNNITGGASLRIPVNILAGEYIINVEDVISTDTDASTCGLLFLGFNETVIETIQLKRQAGKYHVTLSSDVILLLFRPSDSYTHSSEDTFIISGFEISQYVPLFNTLEEIENNIDNLKNETDRITNLSKSFIYSSDNISGGATFHLPMNIPAGKYVINIDNIISTDTDAETCELVFMAGKDTSKGHIQLSRRAGRYTIILDSDIIQFVIHSSDTYVHSTGDTFIIYGFKVSKYIPLFDTIEDTNEKIIAIENTVETTINSIDNIENVSETINNEVFDLKNKQNIINKTLQKTSNELHESINGTYYLVDIPTTVNLNPLESIATGKYYTSAASGTQYTEALVDNERSIYCKNPYDITDLHGNIIITLTTVGEYHLSSGRRCLFINNDGNIISYSDTESVLFAYDSINDKYTAILPIPDQATGFVWSLNVGATFESIIIDGYKRYDTVSSLPDNLTNDEKTATINIQLNWLLGRKYDKYYRQGFIGQLYTNAPEVNGNYMYSETPLNVSKCSGANIIITLSSVGSGHATAGGGACLFINKNNIIISETVRERDLYYYDSETEKYIAEIPIPDEATGFVWAMRRENIIESIRVVGTKKWNNNYSRKIAYVSTTGNDENSGTYINPFATVTKALESGYRDIRLFGGIYSQIINLNNVSTDDCNIKISAVEHNNPVVFISPSNIEKITSATEYSSKVYSVTITNSILSDCKYIYMDGIADPRTEITLTDRHPSQRGNHYRCPDIVRIVKGASIAAIEESDDYMWFASGNTLYFSAPAAPSVSHPIVYAHTQAVTLFMLNNTVEKQPRDDPSKKFNIELNAIETRFMQMNLKCFQTVIARNCRCVASPVWSGVALNRTQYAELINCEACCASVDGFGGQNINTIATNSTAHNSFSKLINCWSHDNYDDGYSEHDRSEAIIIGGLYEWNGKAGITPSYSEVCTCIDVYSRHNYQGFAMVGLASGESGHTNGRNGSTLICYGCVSDSNTRGTQKKGFVVANNNNSAIFINCTAMNEIRGFCALGDTYMKLINCTVVSCNVAKYTEGNPTIEVINGTAVI